MTDVASSLGFADALELVGLRPLMERTAGDRDAVIGLIDGPVRSDHPDLSSTQIIEVGGDRDRGSCHTVTSLACLHGTFITGILVANRGSPAPSICPGCTVVSFPIFRESAPGYVPAATQQELADAIVACVRAGARILNVSAALLEPASKGGLELRFALDHCGRRGVIVVAAAGNQGTIGSSMLTRHPAVLPVVACDAVGRPIQGTNLSATMGRRGLRAPGQNVTSLGADGPPLRMTGTSVAAPFVTGTLALLWSIFPKASAIELRRAATAATQQRPALVPQLLDAEAAFTALGDSRFVRAPLEKARR